MSPSATAAAPLTDDEIAFVERLTRTRRSHPENRTARFVSRELLETLGAEERDMLRRCCHSGAVELDSEIGCYLLEAGNLRQLSAFFSPLIHDWHLAPAPATHVSGSEDREAPGGAAMDLSALGLPVASMRVRVARNLDGFNLPASMDRAERVRLEKAMIAGLQSLIEDPRYGGRIYSLTPEFGAGDANPNLVSREEYQDLVAAHLMFRNMEQDRFMKSAGLAADWPYGRACYVSENREVLVWIGEEDHLRIICMKTGAMLNDVFERLRETVAVIELLPGTRFSFDPEYGYITSCPSNLGTGMRASLHVALPRLMRSGVDIAKLCRHFGLSVCGPGGDRTPIPSGGILELSPTRRAFIRERDIIQRLYDGVRQLAMLDAA